MRRVIFLIALVCATTPAGSQEIEEDRKLIAADGRTADWLGFSVAIFGKTAVVGAPAVRSDGSTIGSVHIFDIESGQLVRKLVPHEGMAGDHFGYSVAMNSSTILVGAHMHGERGAAFVFDAITGVKIQKFAPNDGARGDSFGWSVAISGDTALVGSPRNEGEGSGSGAAYVFDAVTGEQLQKLIPEDGRSSDRFGNALALCGNLAIVGAPRQSAVYVFDLSTGSQLRKITHDSQDIFAGFGSSVAIAGRTVVVGAPGEDGNSLDKGEAYIFDATTGELIHRLSADDGEAFDRFGQSVAISNRVILIGTYSKQGNSGSAYVYDASNGQQVLKLRTSEINSESGFGSSVALSSHSAVIGAWLDAGIQPGAGSAYVFTLSNSSCPPDTNNDGLLSPADFSAWITAFNTQSPECDQNTDGLCTPADFGAWIANFNTGC